ncbi:RipA family octameric membrane protein [Methanolacinia paynteri]|uniref:RipA family octameric membrane protein n=1 Tax=Methanolacinia paynteri TaxID=230356 RepID=UPI00064EC9BC|nr:hypothetical protein [Methanolacinia paynteri]
MITNQEDLEEKEALSNDNLNSNLLAQSETDSKRDATIEYSKQDSIRAYEYFMQLRNSEHKLLMSRTTIFMLLNSALIGLNFSLLRNLELNPKNLIILLIFSLVGFFISRYFYKINMSGIFWTAYWENKLRNCEKYLFSTHGKHLNIFRKHPSFDNDYDWPIIKGKPLIYVSGKNTMLHLSRFFIRIWFILFSITLFLIVCFFMNFDILCLLNS